MNQTDDLFFSAAIDRTKWKKDVQKILSNILGVSEFANKNQVQFIGKQAVNEQKAKIKEIEAVIKATQKNLDNMAPGMAKSKLQSHQNRNIVDLEGEKQGLKEMEKAYELLNVYAKEYLSTTSTLQTQFNKAAQELHNMKKAGKEGTDEFDAQKKKVTELGRELQIAKKESQDLLNPSGFADFVQGLGMVSGGLSSAQAVMGLFGGENENLNKIMLKSQALLAASTTLQQFHSSIVQKGGLIARVMAVQEMARARATDLAAASTGRATIAQRALNLVAKANPYILLATALITVVGALYLFSTKAKSAADTQKELNKAIKEGTAETAKEIVKLELLYKTATNDKLSREQRLKAVKDLKAAYPGLFANINEEIILNGKAAASYLAVKSAILEAAKARAAEKILEKKADDYFKDNVDDKAEFAKIYQRLQKLKEAKRQGLKVMKVDYEDIDNDYSGTVNVDEQIKRYDEVSKKFLKNINKKAREFKKETDVYTSTIIKSNQGLSDATTPPPPKEGTDDWIREKIKKLEEEKATYRNHSADWIRVQKQIDAENEKLTLKKTKKERKDNRQIEEILPKGSIAELQQRASMYQKAIDTAVDGEVKLRQLDKYGKDKDKKGNPYFTGEVASIKDVAQRKFEIEQEIAKKIKESSIKTLKEQFDDSQKLWEDYYSAVASLGEEKAKEIYGGLLKDDASQFEQLKAKQKDLLEKSTKTEENGKPLITDEEKQILLEVSKIIDSLLGKQSELDKFKDKLNNALSGKTALEQLKIIEDYQKKISEDKSNEMGFGFMAVTEEKKREIQQSWKDTYQSILDEQKTFQEKSDEMKKQWNESKETDNYKNGSESDRAKIDKHYTDELSKLSLEAIKASKEWQVAFGDMEYFSKDALNSIYTSLVDFKNKSANTLKPDEMRELEEAIRRVQKEASRIGTPNITKTFSIWRESAKKAEEAQLAYNKAVSQFGAASQQAKEAMQNLITANRNYSNTTKKLFGDIDNFKKKLNDIGEIVSGVKEIFVSLGGDMDSAFGDILNNIEQTLDGLNQFADGASQALEGFASGNILQGIAGTIKGVAGAIKAVSSWLNGDAKKEREIKRQASALKQLETAYNNLAYAAEKAFGSQKYAGQKDLIKNLEQQKIALQNMINSEKGKKDSDQGKIDDWNAQIQAINQSIDQIKIKVVEDILQTSLVDAAAKVGDALVDAFGRGEDSVKALDNAAKDMIKNLLKNQLNLMLQNKMKPILDELFRATGFKEDGTGTFTGLTPEQIAAFKAQVQAAGQSMQSFLEQYGDIFGDLNGNANSLEGAIKGVTEETAGIIAGQMNAIRINQGESLKNQRAGIEIIRQHLLQLSKIEENTRPTKAVYDEIYDLNRRLKAKGF